jgi:hypothetical protein
LDVCSREYREYFPNHRDNIRRFVEIEALRADVKLTAEKTKTIKSTQMISINEIQTKMTTKRKKEKERED